MTTFVLRMEGVNFDATMLDTQELSVIRGASLALLYAPDRVQAILKELGLADVAVLFSGASQAAFTFNASEEAANKALASVREALNSEGEDPARLENRLKTLAAQGREVARQRDVLPLAHLSFVADIGPASDGSDDDLGRALALAEAKNRAQQFQTLTVRLPPFRMATAGQHQLPDQMARILPGEIEIRVPKGSITPRASEPEDDAAGDASHDRAWVSRSFASRRHFGRRMRQAFYRWELPRERQLTEGLQFTDSIDTITAAPPREVPQQIANKVAVFHADGNGFGDIRRQMTTSPNAGLSPAALGSFAEQLIAIRRTKLLQPLLATLTSLPAGWASVTQGSKHRRREALRFEILQWGGDEVTWIAPAWLGFALAERFFAGMQGESIKQDPSIKDSGSFPLTHAGGLVICDRKTPIRRSVAAAGELCELAKKNGKKDPQSGRDAADVIQIEIFESADLPSSLEAHRRRVHAGSADCAGFESLFTLPGREFGTILKRIARMKDPEAGLPRSQFHRALESGDAEAKLRTYERKAGQERAFKIADARILDAPEGETWPLLGPGPRPSAPLALSLEVLLQYWDYAVALPPTVPP